LDSEVSGDSIVPPPLFLPPPTLLLSDVRVQEEVHDEYAEEAGICVSQNAEEPDMVAELRTTGELVMTVEEEGRRRDMYRRCVGAARTRENGGW
jgi:hypothetical protein